jgi:hypothetical protein
MGAIKDPTAFSVIESSPCARAQIKNTTAIKVIPTKEAKKARPLLRFAFLGPAGAAIFKVAFFNAANLSVLTVAFFSYLRLNSSFWA